MDIKQINDLTTNMIVF